jgi:hypothetical protein
LKKVIRNTTFADRLLFFLLIAGSVAGIFISREAMSLSSDVVVELDGKPVYTLPLTVDKTITVASTYGDTVIEIRDRKVRVREAHCPRQLCVKQGWISRGAIICLPNRIVVTVGGGGGPEKKFDAVTG